MAIAVKILRQGSKTTDNKLIVTAGSADTGQLKIQYNGTDIYNNLSGGTADILLGVANTDIYMPLDSNNEIEKGTYRIIFEASVGTSDDQQIGFNVSELNPIINQEVDIYSPYIRLDDNTNYTPANSTVTSSTRTFTLKYPAGSNQSNIVSTTTDIEYDLYITTNNVWTGASQATVNYNVTYTILGVPYAGGNYIDFTYQEIGSGYEPIEVDEENTLCDLYDNINLLREKVYAANISRRGDYATLLSNYQYVGALMSQFREAITCDKTAAAEDILSQIKYIVGAGVPPTASSKASRRVYGASSQITMTISDASLEVQNVDNIIFSGATLTDNGDGQVTITIDAGSSITVEDNTGLAIDGSDVMSTIYNTTIGDSVESVAVGGADPTLASEWKTKTIVQALDTILFPTILASISTPKAISLAVSGVNGIVEIGTTVARTLTATFNDGQIENGDGTTGPDLVGAATQYTFTGTGISSTPQVGNTLAISNTVVSGSNNWAVTVNHSVGTGLYYDNKGVSGVNLDEFRVAGSITDTTSSPTITGRYQQFFGISNTAPANSAEVRSLSNSNFTNTNSFVTPVFSNLSFVIAIPATRNLVSVVTSNNENITGNFSLNTFNVNDAGGTPVSYKVYTFTSVTPLGVTATVTLSGS